MKQTENTIKVGDTVFFPDDLMITGELIKAKVIKIFPSDIPSDTIAHVTRVGSKKPESVWLVNLRLYSKQEVNKVKSLMEELK